MAKPITSRQRGFSLIELMVSLTLGLLVTLAMTGVYQANRGHYHQSERFARMQEAGRLALDVLSHDLSLADFWGGFGTTVDDASAAAFPLANDCGPGGGARWAFNIDNAIEYFMPASLSEVANTRFQCVQDTSAYSYLWGTNVLAVKHVAGTCVSVRTNKDGDFVCAEQKGEAGTVYVRTAGASATFILSDGSKPPSSSDPTAAPIDRPYVARIYYIATDNKSGIPSLRRKYLTKNGNTPTIEDEGEIAEGVEFFHIQFGVADSNLDNNVCDQGNPGDPHLYQYLPLDKTSDTFHSPQHRLQCAVSARIYVLVRSLERDTSLPEDKKKYDLGRLNAARALTGNETFSDDHFQRRVYTTTVQLRNRIYQTAAQRARPPPPPPPSASQ